MHSRREVLGGLLALAGGPTLAQRAFQAGTHYEVLGTPVRTDDPGRIEVAEVFAYSCPHCMHFEPLLSEWLKRQGADVALVQVHAMWNPMMEPLARGYYSSVALKIKERSHEKVFQALQLEQRKLARAEDWAVLFEAFGVARDKTLATFSSFGVTSQLKAAEARVRAYKVGGTPEMIVNGKYRVSTRMAGGQPQMLQVVDFLVAQERTARGR